jgi:hypothetical protein
MLSTADLDGAFEPEQQSCDHRFDWVLERRSKDGTSKFEFKYQLTEEEVREYAESFVKDSTAGARGVTPLPNTECVLVFKYTGKVSRISSTKWE